MNDQAPTNSVRNATRILLAVGGLYLGRASLFGATENWPVTYNHGVTAYRTNDFTGAAATFEQSTATPDRPLQAKAFYNFGNAQYRLGQAAESQSLEQALPVFKKSLQAYERALAANPQDADAKFNHDLVQKKIAELEKKQEQQRQQQQQQKPQNQSQQKNDQQQPQTGKADKPQQPQNQQPDSHPDETAQSAQQKQHEQGQQPQPQEAKPEAGQTNLDKQRAAAMLDNLREDERNWNFFPEVQMQDLKDTGESVKDW